MNALDRIQQTKESFEEIAREQERQRIKQQKLREMGVDVDAIYVWNSLKLPPVYLDTEPRIPVSPYAKFDKYHHKKKKK